MADHDNPPPGPGPTIDHVPQPPASAHDDNMHIATERQGDRIGPYKLLQRLGEGGMGSVWMAEQEQPVQRRVALKFIKAGMDSRSVLARFEAERQALAMMDHPNISKVLDASMTPAGRPYFAMELVKGVPLCKYCDDQHLTPLERLNLFIPICQAVQHAHQKGIIHRDLKPSNILVGLYDGQPVPKIIDFGIAKATHHRLTDKTLFTEIGQMIGTLAYMAPEQAETNNLDIDTRADIYSLGVILYELLAGSPPFTAKQLKDAGFDEARRVIREVEPAKPSTKLSSSDELPSIAAKRKLEPKRLTRFVAGDLDWVVMKCLEKDRARRYDTANGLAMDIQRYLHFEPVVAGPPSARYQLRKFVNRNRSAVVAAVLVLTALLFGLAGTVWQARQAELARQDAVAQFKIAEVARADADAKRIAADEATKRAQANFRLALDAFNDMIHGIQTQLAARGDTQDLRKELLYKAQAGLQKLLTEAEQAGGADSTLTWVHFRMGDLHLILGETEKALQEYRLGSRRAESLASADPKNATAQRDLSVSFDRLGDVTVHMGNAAGALDYYRQALVISERLAKADPNDAQAQTYLSASFEKLGNVTRQMGNVTGALDYYRLGMAVRERLANADPRSFQAQRDLNVSFSKLGDVTLQMGDAVEALEFFRQAHDVSQRLATADPKNADAQRNLFISFHRLGDATRQMGNISGAHEHFRHGLDVTNRLAKADPKNAQAQRDLAISFEKLGDITLQKGNRLEALMYYRQDLEISERLAKADPKNAQAQSDLSKSFDRLGNVTLLLGFAPGALTYYRQSHEISERLAKADPHDAKAQSDLFVAFLKLGDVTLQLGNAPGALEYYRQCLEVSEWLAKADPKNVEAQRDLCASFLRLGDVTLQMGDAPAALKYYRQDLEISERLAKAEPKNAEAQMQWFISTFKLGTGHQGALQFSEATSWLEKARASLQRFQETGWITKPDQMVGTGSFRQWSDEIRVRLLACSNAQQAIVDLAFALKQPAKDIGGLLDTRLRVLEQRDDLSGCVATAEAIVAHTAKDSGGLYKTASTWSLCCGLAKTRGADPGTPELAKEYGDKAMNWLKQAVAAGYKNVAHMKQDKDLDSLRDRDDFKALIKELEAKAATQKPAEEKKKP